MAVGNVEVPESGQLRQLLGYLNFSSGAHDAKAAQAASWLFAKLRAAPGQGSVSARVHGYLRQELAALSKSTAAFAECSQAEGVLDLIHTQFWPAYLAHHQELLAHQKEDDLMQPFFWLRCAEAVLCQGPPWTESSRITAGALKLLNDYVGHRPIPVLRTVRSLGVYAHERIRPVPIYLKGAGIAEGPYAQVLACALDILKGTNPALLHRACLDFDVLEEIAFDPRSYDFDHPTNKRPNYHFGQWDPDHIDLHGRYTRYVVQQVTLDSLMERVHSPGALDPQESLFEAATVLAGTTLMATATSGRGPDTHDSTVTLATLLPRIAKDRDQFYAELLERMTGPHGARLREEAQRLRQPFAGARQHLNERLSRRRAVQLQHMELSRLFFQMGYPQESHRHAQFVQSTSCRTWCKIQCSIAMARKAIDGGDPKGEAKAHLKSAINQMKAAIDCGALPDPWTMLGFQGMFSLFRAVENSIPDHRLDDLIELIRELCRGYTDATRCAAATGNAPLMEEVLADFSALAKWWDPFGSSEVESLDGIRVQDAVQSTEKVAVAVQAWYKAGDAAGDVAFWRTHLQQFDSAKSYSLVIEALLDRGDFISSMALFMHWLGQADVVKLTEESYSFHRLAQRWMTRVIDQAKSASDAAGYQKARDLAKKFFDFLEANAGDFWEVPALEIKGPSPTAGGSTPRAKPETARHDPDEEDEDEDSDEPFLYQAAYEEVSYLGSSEDGVEGNTLDELGSLTDFELEHESRRIVVRLDFLRTLASLFRTMGSWPKTGPGAPVEDSLQAALTDWCQVAHERIGQLEELLTRVHGFQLPEPQPGTASLSEFDRRHRVKHALVERIIATTIDMADAEQLLWASQTADTPESVSSANQPEEPSWETLAPGLLRAAFAGDAAKVNDLLPELREVLAKEPLLYVPLDKGGDPKRVIRAQRLQQFLRFLMSALPRLGLLAQTVQMLRCAQAMERDNGVGPGGVTEFDRLFSVACSRLVESVVHSSESWPKRPETEPDQPKEQQLFDALNEMTELLLQLWLEHSRLVRISVLEKTLDRRKWRDLEAFIKEYGGGLLEQQCLNLGNLRAILHRGVERWLADLIDSHDVPDWKLLQALEEGLSRKEAANRLTTIFEAVVENYPEYMDYNSTTTQSDRGELFHILMDFLRLKTTYERVAWNLKPVLLVHESLVYLGKHEVAELWRQGVVEHTREGARNHLDRYAELTKTHGVRLQTVKDLLEDEFVRPLLVDRLRSFVGPAVKEADQPELSWAFKQLCQEIEQFVEHPCGVGLDLPPWLASLEHEVNTVKQPGPKQTWETTLERVPRVRVSLADFEKFLAD